MLFLFCYLHHLGPWINLIGVSGAQFAFYNDAVNYYVAKIICTNIGGILYEPRDQDVMQIVINQAQTASLGEFWIGINDMENEGTFVYDSDSSPLSFTNWKSGEPNNANSGEDCAIVNFYGKWVDLHCTDYKRSTVCVREIGKGISIFYLFFLL